ncbi:E3 ubiquitin-protein ligase RNF8-like isoform X1 [Danaus plexippus]|uniref:E3 ubiquitin-protein ligase RNF8-like isoform X1 n=1 Tax=Danaus plexippus TaxID=13037 RepID=UPI002AAFA307|nr:E3 ubiquitin-protein ligase RNF8-like isoform X1 [Danaus plexippus]
MDETYAKLISCKPLKNEFQHLREINISSEEFTIGRGLNNMTVIPFLAISRNHCIFQKCENDWIINDNSTFGIVINGKTLGKGNKRNLKHGDIIELDPTKEFVYNFNYVDDDFLPSSRKRIKLETNTCTNLISNVKIKFEESQNYEMKRIEDKIENTKQMKTTNLLLKEQLETEMKRKINILESEYSSQINNLKGEKDEVQKQKSQLIEERETQLTNLKNAMNAKLEDLKEQIKKHNESEMKLVKENKILKEKLKKEREEFLLELNRESSSKQEMLEKLTVKMREQEELRTKEKKQFQELLQKETESLKLAKEKELSELTEEKRKKELELITELNNIKGSLEKQVKLTEIQKREALQKLNDQMEEMKKMKNEDQIKMEQLKNEREEIQKQLKEAQQNAVESIEKLKTRVTEREIELAALAAERIQKQAEQSTEVINSLQEQLERVRNQLHNVENENKKLLEHNTSPENKGGCSKDTITEFGEIMESELQCSICAELFVQATTLNCSHTFCKYCITMWKKKKKECPICRAPITSECKSLVLDSFIEKMLLSLSEEMKQKRSNLLKSRDELECELARQDQLKSYRRNSDEYEEESDSFEEEAEDDDFFDYGSLSDHTYSNSGSDGHDFDVDSTGESPLSSTSYVPGIPGSFYGGYGRCFRCGAFGHWAPGCPNRL